MAIVFDKKLEGTFIYGRPTGNNARSNPDKIEKFKVVRVKRKYFDLIRYFRVDSEETYGDGNSYCPATGALESEIRTGYGGNAGYKFFDTIEEVKRDIDKDNLIDKLADKLTRYDLRKLTYEQVIAIQAIVEG